MKHEEKMSKKVDQGLETRQRLIKVARKQFADHGFTGTRFDEIALSEGLTTGALYHHFKNKVDLFKSVFIDCSEDIATAVGQAADQSNDRFKGIIAGCEAYIRETISPEYKKIVLEDAISVLGWKEWKSIDDATSELSLVEAIQDAQKQNLISKKVTAKSIARLLSGATNELALWVSESDDMEKTLSESVSALKLVINNLKTRK
jgi:AcrR family transcriptional regulator